MSHNALHRNSPGNAHLASRINKILLYLQEKIPSDAFHWLKTDAIYYPELIDNTLQNIDEMRFKKGKLTKQERQELFDNIVKVHESYRFIDTVVDEYISTY